MGQETNQSNIVQLQESNAQLQVTLASKDQEIATLNKQIEVQSATLAQLQQAENTRSSEAVIGKFVSEGKVVPAQKEAMVALHMSMNEEQKKRYEASLAELPNLVALGKGHSAGADDAPTGNVSEQVRAFQREQNIATFAEAVEILQATNPELFKED